MQKIGGVVQTKETMGQKGFFASLFDFSFTELITTKIIKVLYGLGILGAILVAGSLMIPAIKHSDSAGEKILAVILFPLLALLYIIIFRVFYEIIIVIFRIAEYSKDIRDIARQGQRKS